MESKSLQVSSRSSHVEASTLRPMLVTDSTAFAGTERHILDLAKALTANGVSVCIGCPTDSILARKAQEIDVPVITAPKTGFALKMIPRIIDCVRSGQVNIIHTHNGVSHFTGAIATWLSGRAKCVATQHFVHPARSRRKGMQAHVSNSVHKWAGMNTHRFIAISKAVANSFQSEQPDCGERVVVVHNGIYVPSALVAADEVRAKLKIASYDQLLVCAARLAPEKNIDVLIRALPAVLAQFPHIRCVIAGEGQSKASLAKLIDSLNLGKAVELVGFQEDVLSIIGACDIFVLPSECEPFGLVVLEAMALEKPVIAANSGGPAELINDGVNGCLFSPGEPQSLAQQIIRLLQSPETRKSIARSAKKTCVQEFLAPQMANRTMAVYSQALMLSN